jgi:hypothetical protein
MSNPTADRLCSIHKTPVNTWVRCRSCDGLGERIIDDDDPGDPFYGIGRCTDCQGRGGTEECEFCYEESMDL